MLNQQKIFRKFKKKDKLRILVLEKRMNELRAEMRNINKELENYQNIEMAENKDLCICGKQKLITSKRCMECHRKKKRRQISRDCDRNLNTKER